MVGKGDEFSGAMRSGGGFVVFDLPGVQDQEAIYSRACEIISPLCGLLASVETLEQRCLLSRPIGIDVSDYQPTINWTTVKNAGYTFAWSKSTEGTALLPAHTPRTLPLPSPRA